jgi:hypothetical protein
VLIDWQLQLGLSPKMTHFCLSLDYFWQALRLSTQALRQNQIVAGIVRREEKITYMLFYNGFNVHVGPIHL